METNLKTLYITVLLCTPHFCSPASWHDRINASKLLASQASPFTLTYQPSSNWMHPCFKWLTVGKPFTEVDEKLQAVIKEIIYHYPFKQFETLWHAPIIGEKCDPLIISYGNSHVCISQKYSTNAADQADNWYHHHVLFKIQRRNDRKGIDHTVGVITQCSHYDGAGNIYYHEEGFLPNMATTVQIAKKLMRARGCTHISADPLLYFEENFLEGVTGVKVTQEHKPGIPRRASIVPLLIASNEVPDISIAAKIADDEKSDVEISSMSYESRSKTPNRVWPRQSESEEISEKSKMNSFSSADYPISRTFVVESEVQIPSVPLKVPTPALFLTEWKKTAAAAKKMCSRLYYANIHIPSLMRNKRPR